MITIGFILIVCTIQDLVHANLALIRDYFCKNTTRQIAEDLEIGDIYHYRRQLGYSLIAVFASISIAAIFLKYNELYTWIEAYHLSVQTAFVSQTIYMKIF
jgi:hypothetical protein